MSWNTKVSVSSRVFAQSLSLDSVSQRQCLVLVSKTLAETPALEVNNIKEDYLETQIIAFVTIKCK